jgi:hypothetical protein
MVSSLVVLRCPRLFAGRPRRRMGKVPHFPAGLRLTFRVLGT